ncbi:MAG: NADH-quinone oxidoreductase subunit N [Chloroflexi bacterium]|nr:NADH-quinone oxidoreductase subunit N [Chloroflexota bacterium]
MNVLDFQSAHTLALLPEIVLLVVAGIVMWLDVRLPESQRRQVGFAASIGMFAAMASALIAYNLSGTGQGAQIFGGMIRNDFASFLFRMIFMFAGAMTALLSVDVEKLNRKGEYFTVIIGCVFGMNFMAMSADLIMLYLAVETTSIGLYALAGFLHDDDKSAESGLKYFLFGAMTSAVMLYGFSLIFGFTGETNLYRIAEVIKAGKIATLPLVVSALMVLVGVGFKVALVPFHFWTPDVYEGAPTPVTAFLSVASKSAGFAVLIRIFLIGFAPNIDWLPMLLAMATVTMTLGNLLALPQKNIKRLLAYSSIAHAGYAMMGVVALSKEGIAATVFYLTGYVFTNLAAFAVVILFSRVAGSDEIADYAGMSRRSPGLALAMLVAFLSLGGMPPLVGFAAKFFVFAAAIKADLIWLVFVGVINSIIGLYYYLIVLKVVYVKPAPEGAPGIPISRPYAFALIVLSFAIVATGTAAAPWLSWAFTAAGSLF